MTAILTMPKSAGDNSLATITNEAQLKIWLDQSAVALHAKLVARERSICVWAEETALAVVIGFGSGSTALGEVTISLRRTYYNSSDWWS